MTTTLPGGFWYPERDDLHRATTVGTPTGPIAIAIGDAIGNRFSFGFPLRCEGVGFRVKLWGACRVQLLDAADTVLGTRDWAAEWIFEAGAVTRTDLVLQVEWPAAIELAANVVYRVLLTSIGAAAVEAFAPPIDPAWPGTGILVRRIAGVWSEDDTRRCETTLRITGL